MPSDKLPEGKTPSEAAHDLVLALVASGHFYTKDKNPEEIYRVIQKAETEYRRLFQQRLDLINIREDKDSQELWANLAL